MNILADMHHSDLMESLYRLFEDRIGATLYMPRGLEWRDEGYWHFGWQYPDGGLGVAKQFLLAAEVDSLQPKRVIHWVTLAEAKAMDWDVVMCSVPDNESGYQRFAKEKGARFAVQVGNVNQPVFSADAIILDATGQYPGGVPFTPEFDPFIFAPRPRARYLPAVAYGRSTLPFIISSFVNLFPHLPGFRAFDDTSRALPDWEFKVYGHKHEGYTDWPVEFIKPVATVADLMAVSEFGWHDKVTGDGFGYVIHYWAAIGRPIIGHASYYARQTAADLWNEGETSIDLGLGDPVERMREIVANGRLEEMGRNINEVWRARKDWEASAQRVAAALGLLVTA